MTEGEQGSAANPLALDDDDALSSAIILEATILTPLWTISNLKT